jgi:hypothetical protein
VPLFLGLPDAAVQQDCSTVLAATPVQHQLLQFLLQPWSIKRQPYSVLDAYLMFLYVYCCPAGMMAVAISPVLELAAIMSSSFYRCVHCCSAEAKHIVICCCQGSMQWLQLASS